MTGEPTDPARLAWDAELSPDLLDTFLARSRRPAVLLCKTARGHGKGAPGCWLGGAPTLPADYDWPWYELDGVDTVPMHFISQLDLSHVPPISAYPELPLRGTLFFFFDPIIAPHFSLSEGGSAVFYVDEDLSDIPAREMPEIPDIEEISADEFPALKDPVKTFETWSFRFAFHDFHEESFADNRSFLDAVNERGKRQQKLQRKFAKSLSVPHAEKPKTDRVHNMFGGTPACRRNDGDVPLLTISSDNDLNLFFGDDSALVFWIARKDLENGDFDAVYLQHGE